MKNLNCFDCNKPLELCTCIEDTIDMKQETLEEAANKYVEDFDLSFYDTVEEIPVKEIAKKDFTEGAKWQAERMYSEEDLLSAFEAGMMFIGEDKGSFREWFEQFKKK